MRLLGVVGVILPVTVAAWWLWLTVSGSRSPLPAAVTLSAGPSQPDGTAAPQISRGSPPGPPRESTPERIRQAPRRASARLTRQTTSSAAPEPSWRSDFRLALYYHRAGDFERALAHYKTLLARNELNAEVRNNLGLLYQQKGLLEESAREFQRAIFINPKYTRAHSNYGVTLMRQGKLDLAAAEFSLAASIDSRDVDARINLALAQKARREHEQARATLLNALSIDPSSAAAHYNLALLYDESGEAARALEHYREFLDHAGVEHASLAADVRARVEALSAKGQ
jgi:Tfp pilus assembly protein PilF